MYSPFVIAGAILSIARDHGFQLTPMELNKLVYLSHGWHLGLTGHALTLERPQAWKFGPVYKSLYHFLKPYGGDQLPDDEHLDHSVLPVEDGYVNQLVGEVWGRYGGMTGVQLSGLTHQKGSPWHKTWHDHGGSVRRGTEIPDPLISAHYREKIELAQSENGR